MKRNQPRIIVNLLIAGILVLTTLFSTACSSTSSTTTSTTSQATLILITITPNPADDLPVSFVRQFTATGTYSDGSTADISIRSDWTSSDENVATISTSGLATGIATGTTSITATYLGITSAPLTLTTVPTPELSSIEITPNNPNELEVDFTQKLVATGKYVDGSTSDITSQVTWTSSDENIATISSSGVATGIAPGTVNVSATLSGIVSPSVNLTVKVATLTDIVILPTTPETLGVGLSQQFAAIGIYSDDSTATITSEVNWNSSDEQVASISSSGIATGVGAGSTDITASLSGITSQTVTMEVSELSSVALSPDSVDSLTVGSTKVFKVIGTYSNGISAMITSRVTWFSSNPDVATVSSSGTVTCVAPGSTDIWVQVSGLTSEVVTLTIVSPEQN